VPVAFKLGIWPHNELSASGMVFLLRRRANYNPLATEHIDLLDTAISCTVIGLANCDIGSSVLGRGQLKCDGTRAETRFRLSAKRTSPFKSAGTSAQSTTGSRGVRISDSNAG
jgi:hypothetical protein